MLPTDDNALEKRLQSLEELSVKRMETKDALNSTKPNKPKEKHPEGTRVVLSRNEFITRKDGKLEPKWFGPFIVSAHGPNNTYRLKTPNGKELTKLVNADRVDLYYDRFNRKKKVTAALNEVVKSY